MRDFVRFLFISMVAIASLPASADTPSGSRQQELQHMLKQECGSCHGMTLKGGLGPALTEQAMSGKDSETLVATILYGRPGTAMPRWDRFLNEAEAEWLVERLKRGEFDD